MQKRILYVLLGWLMLFGWQKTFAQADTLCDQNENKKIFGELYFNYGSVTNAYSAFNRSTFVMGQPLASPRNMLSQAYQAGFGVYSPWYLPPQPPILIASQGDFKDRIKVSWNVNPLSTPPSGFVLYRDGSFLADLGEDVREFLDFNTQAGEYYEYSIVAKNVFGTGSPSKYVGFVNPNGVVSGKVETNSGNPVPGVEVRLTPLTGNSMAFDGVNDELCVTYHNEFPTDKFTVSAYVKLGDVNNEGGIIDWGSSLNKNWWITTTKNNEPKGYIFHVGNGTGSDSLKYYLPNLPTNPENVNNWHQITMVYNGSALSVMVDGEFVGTKPASIVREKNYLNIGSKIGNVGFFKGKIDDIRVYNRPLTQTEVNSTKNRSVSKSEMGLVSYWKMDEGIGVKVFDNTTVPTNANVYGATFSSDKPEVYSAGVTDVTGYYVIDGINYSQTESFRATPMKNFEFNSALEFNAADKSYGNLTDFDMPDTSTVQVLFHPFDLKSRQTVLSKGSLYEAYIDNGKLFLNLNGTITDLGTVKAKYYHLAVALDNTAGSAKVYLEGELKGTVSFTGTSNWKNGSPWLLATNSTNAATGKFYTGLVDEFVIYKTALPQNVIQEHYVVGLPKDSTTALQWSYFDLNEATDTKVYDYAAINFGGSTPREGAILRASWSNNARRKETKPHEFEPNVRVVNINTSNTAIGNVDFKAVSTVNVSGYVRFTNTFCFEDQVEILVNGQSNFPQIYTDKDGKWSADFEPGRTIKLSASYKDHVFGPSFFEIRKIQAPKAGIIFLDNTKRSIRGQIAGGECRQSILPVALDPTAYQVLKIESTNGCFSRTDTLRNPDGKYIFDNLPAIAFETKYLFHSYNNSIKDYFNNKGGQQTDLRDIQGDTLDFVYISHPEVRIDTSKILFNKCDQLFAYQTLSDPNKKLKVKFQTFENYYGGECIVDSVKYTVNNDIGDRLQETFQSDSTVFLYESTIGVPNILEPYTKKLQVTADYKGSIATNTINVIVFGMLSRPASFTTSANANPYLILRDPPGDQSTATIEKGTTSCTSVTRAWGNSVGATIASEWTIGEIRKVVAAPLGVGEIKEVGTETKIKLSSTNTYSNTGEEVKEVCITTLKSISTSTDLVGRDGDIFAGNGLNFKMGLNDRISLGADSCSVKADTIVWVSPNGFNTEFIYTRYHIMTDVIPSLTLARNTATDSKERAKFQTSLDNWNKIMLMDSLLLAKTDEGKENISFDAGVNYTKSVTTSAVKSLSSTHEFSSENSLEAESTFQIPFLKSELSGGVTYSHGETWADANSTTDEVTFSYNLADDDIGDNFSVDIAQFAMIPTGQTDMDELNKRRTEKFSSIEYTDLLWKKHELDSLENKINELIALATVAKRAIDIRVGIAAVTSTFLVPFYTKKEYNPGKELRIFPVTSAEIAEYILIGSSKANFPNPSDREAFKRYVRRDRKLNLPEFVSPSFTLVAGESMCPWEGSMTINETTGEPEFEGTLNREQVSLSVDKNVQINVPKNTPAVYHLKLGNLGSAIKDQDQMTYKLGLVSGTNPRGAVVKVNGFNITEPIPFVLNSREVLDATLTIERGPEDFDYTGIKVAFFSECEVGVPNQNSKDDIAPLFYQEVSLDAYFVEPCSEVDIAFPLQNFVSTPADLNKQSISLIEYDKNDADLKDILVQYRRVDGDGAWVNIQKFLPEELGSLQTNLIWNTELLRDDFYEIRAITSCNNTSLAPGISTIVRGKLEREAPIVVGVPEPGDGTWDPGDEISITFNEPINCDKVVQADLLANNTIGLYDATTNALVDATITCVGNKIVIVPNINPVFFENRTFRVVVSGKDYDDAMLAQNPNHQRAAIRDKAGNMIEKTIKWEFAVNQNNLEWVGTDIIETNEVLKPFSVKRQIRNRGGSIASFRMESVPSWLTVSPATGTLNPGQVADVTLTFQQDLLIGDYLDTLQMVGSKGKEPLLIDYRVRCPQPKYEVSNPEQYEGTMNMVVDLSIFGISSTDPSDVVVAKIGGQIRGVAKVAYYRNIPADRKRWLAFMTVYGNPADEDKPIEFTVWQGAKCNEFVEILEEYSYHDGSLAGTPLEPTPVSVLNLVKKCIPLNRGFNWVSFNLDLGTGRNTVTNVLKSLKNKSGAYIKTDNNFAEYLDNYGWDMSDSLIYPTKRYMVFVAQRDTVCIKGAPYKSAEYPIAIKNSWNWVGYVPSIGMTVTQALRGLTPLNGDIIKSQTLFAQYVAGVGWVGNLSFLEPLKGYLLKISNAGTLTYPTTSASKPSSQVVDGVIANDITAPELALAAQDKMETPMTFNFAQYEQTMNLIGHVNGIAIDADDELRAYIDGQLVGVNKSIVNAKDRLFFETIYYQDEQNIQFKLYKADRDKEYDLDRKFVFKGETLAGLVEAPIEFNLVSLGANEVTLSIDDVIIKQPNTVFPTVSVPAGIVEPNVSCTNYAVSTILPTANETKPTCAAITQEGNMTAVIRVKFNERTSFVSTDDVLTFINPNTNTVVGCATFNTANKLFYATIGGNTGSATSPIDVRYYSSSMKKTFTLKSAITYQFNAKLGNAVAPYELNFSPLSVTINNGIVSAVMRDTSWIGDYGVNVFALNCAGYSDGQTSFTFRRLKSNDCSYSFSKPTTSSPVCKGSSLQLSANKGDSYVWVGPNGFSSTLRNPVIGNVSTAASGIYTLTVTSYRCPITATTNVTVKALTMTATTNTPVCEKATLNLSSNGGTSYLWKGPNGFSSTEQNPTITKVGLTASGTYKVIMNNDGCTDSLTTDMVINPLPVVTVSSEIISVCQKSTLKLGVSGGTSYLWNGPNSFSSTLQNPEIANADSLVIGTYTVEVTTKGCTSTGSIAVKLKLLPQVPRIMGDSVMCAGRPNVLTSVSNSSATFTWSNGLTGSSISVAPKADTTYIVTALMDGCTSISRVLVMKVNPLYTSPTITANNMQICKGESAILTASCPAVTDVFRWETPSANNATASNKNTRTVTEPGVYRGYCVPLEGCTSANVGVVITQPDNCNGQNFITVTPIKPVICPNSSITLSASGCSGTLTWLGGPSTQTGTSMTVSPTVTTTYLVQCNSGGSASVDVVVATTNVVVTKNITTGIERVKATEIIESDKKIGDITFTPAPSVSFEAGKAIILKPGFVAEKLSNFKAEIKTCN